MKQMTMEGIIFYGNETFGIAVQATREDGQVVNKRTKPLSDW